MPNEIPVPRAPRLVVPKSFAPEHILAAIVQTQKNAYEDLVVRPLRALGVTPPPPVETPEMMLERMVKPGGQGSRGQLGEVPPRVTPTVGEVGRGSL